MTNGQYLSQERDRLGCYGKCDPVAAVLCKRLNDGGVMIAGWHCQTCGSWKAVKKAMVDDLPGLPDYDHGLTQRLADERNAQWAAEKQAVSDRWWGAYSSYLKSERWRRKRELVLTRDQGSCRACLSRPAAQVHHLSYAHVGDEPLFDLVAVCEPCHEKITSMDEDRRKSGVTPLDKGGW